MHITLLRLNQGNGWPLAGLSFFSTRKLAHCCGLFQAAPAKQGRKRYFREKLRSFFFTWLLPDRETLYRALAYGPPRLL